MFRKELTILGAMAAGIFLLVAAVGSVAFGLLQREARLVAVDTLPGLVNVGEAMVRIQDNWLNTVRLPNLAADERIAAMRQITSNSTEVFWQKYRAAAIDVEDARLFEDLQKSRAAFLQAREQYFSLMQQGDLGAAQRSFTTGLEPAYEIYKRTAVRLFDFNSRYGEARAGRIVAVTRWAPLAAALLAVALFACGFLIGLKGAFSSMVFATRHRRGEPSSARAATAESL